MFTFSDPSESPQLPQSLMPGSLERRDWKGTISTRLSYWLHLPPDYAARESCPLLLFLHGAGERGEDLEKVKAHGPPKLLASGRPTPCSQFIVVAPQCPTDQYWSVETLLALLDDLERELKVDRSRISVTGLSMGGYGVWALVTSQPRRFAAAVPICGGGSPILARLTPAKEVPVWAFHGACDPVVPLRASEEMVKAWQDQGGDAKLTVYPEAGHDSWTETYANPELYRWLLDHRRG